MQPVLVGKKLIHCKGDKFVLTAAR